jgi:hypothetical protein
MKFFLAAIFLSLAASAEVVDKSPAGFLVKHTATVSASPAEVYGMIVNVSRWWEDAHTWSGSAKNLSIAAKVGGCFCEKLPPDGELQHMTVIYAAPGKLLRMSGALGPMQGFGIAGVLTFELKPREAGTEIAMTYSAGGYFQGGLQTMAEPADHMLAAQFANLKKLFTTPK